MQCAIPLARKRKKQFATPKSAAELRDLLVESIIEIRAGKLDPKIGTDTKSGNAQPPTQPGKG